LQESNGEVQGYVLRWTIPGVRLYILLEHYGHILQRTDLKENTLQYGLGYLDVHVVPCGFDKVQGIVPFDHDQCTGPGGGHTFTGPDYGLHIGIGWKLVLF